MDFKEDSEEQPLAHNKSMPMNEFRITKYDPSKRNSEGNYLDQDEWTCFSEVGKKLSMEEYELVESKYIQAAVDFIGNDIENIKAINIENHGDEDISDLSIPMTLGLFRKILQNILRNNYWCSLESNDSFVHIGWDYYMFVGCMEKDLDIIKQTEKNGLYVEECESPYKEE